MKKELPNSINLLSFPFEIVIKPKDFVLKLGKEKVLGKCDLSVRKITLKRNDMGLIPFFHEICEGRHLLQWENFSEAQIHREAIFWLSIFEQLNKKSGGKKYGKRKRKSRLG